MNKPLSPILRIAHFLRFVLTRKLPRLNDRKKDSIRQYKPFLRSSSPGALAPHKTQKMSDSQYIPSHERKRLAYVAIGLFVFFSLLIVQFYRIQIVDGDKWKKHAQAQQEWVVKEPFRRGTFWSNITIKQGHPQQPQALVMDVPKFHLHVDPASLPEEGKHEIASKLAAVLQLGNDAWEPFFAEFQKQSRNRRLLMWLEREKRDEIMSWWMPYARKHRIARNAIFFIRDYQRSYPFGKLLGQVLHTIRDYKDEETMQGVPTGGLEGFFNDELKGKQGKRLVVRSPRHPLALGSVIDEAENGADIYLTINHHLQTIVEEQLEMGVKRAEAKAGWAVMMDPCTGEILALAQYPFFYPEHYRDYFNNPDLIESTRLKAVTDANEPGSIMKPLTIAVCLNANEEARRRGEPPVIGVDEKIAVGSGRFPGRTKPITDTSPVAYLNMPLALQKSSNIYMGRAIQRVIDRLGNQWYRHQLENVFHFGHKTGIEFPGETAGVLPTPGKLHPNGTLEWSLATPYSLVMGYNIQVNSLQMVRAYAILANGGFDIKPTLIRKIVRTENDGSEKVLLENVIPPKELKRILSKEVVDQVISMTKYCSKPGGKAFRGDVPGYTEAAKTGTAEKIVNGQYAKDKNLATFIGFTPVTHPRFVLLVSIDEPRKYIIPGVGGNAFGGVCAAPVFREIAKRSLEYMGVALDDPCGYPVGDPRRDEEKADWVKESRQLQEIYKKWNH
jgi:cell division protein FtsI (penicillin-binding protein 3)